MDEENHLNPLAPSKLYGKSDDYISPIIEPFRPNHKKHHSKCLVHVLLLIVILSAISVILGSIFLRIEAPSFRLSRVTVISLQRNLNTSSLSMTMEAEIRIHNLNFGDFVYSTGALTTLMYENATIGVGVIGNGRIGSRRRRYMNVTVSVSDPGTYDFPMVNSTTNFTRDLGLGLLNLRTSADLRGEVRVTSIMDRFRTSVMDCRMLLNLTSGVVQNLNCS